MGKAEENPPNSTIVLEGWGAREWPIEKQASPNCCKASKGLCCNVYVDSLTDSICYMVRLWWFTILALCCCNHCLYSTHHIGIIWCWRKRRWPMCHNSDHIENKCQSYICMIVVWVYDFYWNLFPNLLCDETCCHNNYRLHYPILLFWWLWFSRAMIIFWYRSIC